MDEHNAAVICKHCQALITFTKPAPLPEIIGLRCSECGRRRVYTATDIQPLKS